MTHDVIVLGVGSVGAACLRALARAGISALGVDRWAPPHRHGSHHGDTRITRLGVGEGAEYVPFAQRSHQIWRELEAESATDILHQIGGVVIDQPGVGENHGQSDFLGSTIAAANAHGIAHEILGADELAHLLPMMRFDGDERGYYEPSAGYVRPDKAITALLDSATRAGASLLTDCPVMMRVDVTGRRPAILLETGEWLEADKIVVTAGARIKALVPDFPLPLTFTRQVLHWFAVAPDHAASFAPDKAPIFIRQTRHGDFYGFPMVDGPAGGVKIAAETAAGMDIDPDSLPESAPEAESLLLHDRLFSRYMNGVERRVLRSGICRYAELPGARFLMDQHPQHKDVIIASTCSGHGFKHSAALGEKLAHMATGIAIDPALAAADFKLSTHRG